ncbi:coiled-coil domain-containing protein 24 isoform X2 [Xyrichtys novacula]|uniref:Coiled-coil domain-containing protein 24 isoform X2 n=1 Tax=Xyrichtys novacula TaxID=13765 RepID=A0AAV1GIC0_XYRNO|nr:coiled-coil domain-containing protein 24 isoform X2 [Xyrichtys novacula]
MLPPDGSQLWCPSQSLWNLIAEHVPGSELSKIRSALGPAFVDMYKDKHTEAEKWYSVWQASQQGNFGSRAGTPHPHQQGSPLTDPPAVKELLRAEVKMLLQTLGERVSRLGRNGEELLFRYKPETVDYALGHLDSCQRKSTDLEDTYDRSRPSSHCSVRSSAEDEIDSMRDKLNVTDIDQVVDRLKTVLMEEYEELRRLVKYFKEEIKQRCMSQAEKSEPTLSELRELRGAIQMDLELYPSSLAASPSRASPLPAKDLKNRLSAGQKVPRGSMQDLSTTPAPKPHSLPSLCQTKPRPPLNAPPNKTSASVKLINSPSLCRTPGQQRSALAASGRRKIRTPICNRIASSGHLDSLSNATVPGPDRDQIKDETPHDCSASPEQDRSCMSSPSFQIENARNSPVHDTHQPPHSRIHSPSRKSDLPPQPERNRRPALRLGHINTITSSSRGDAGTYSSNATDHPVSAKSNLTTQSGQQNHGEEGSTASAPSQSGKEKSSNGNNTSDKGHFDAEVSQQPGQAVKCIQTESRQINRLFFATPKKQHKGSRNQQRRVQEAKTELEFIGKFHQPVPPPRVST